MAKRVEGALEGQGLKIAVVVSRFNRAITRRLLDGALDRLTRLGVDEEEIDVVWVPGAFELPQAVRALAEQGGYDGILPLGCVIRGETPHFDHICRAVTAGLSRLALETDVPLAFGVLTVDTAEQAQARAGVKVNKGAEAAESLVELINALRNLAG